jgi:hypothetical protein
MTEAPRVSPQYVRNRMQTGADMIVVCAYDDPAKCSKIKIQGSIDYLQLESRLGAVPKDKEIVFYCA